jgi:hypothetical protein
MNIPTDGSILAWMQKKIDTVAPPCIDKFSKKSLRLWQITSESSWYYAKGDKSVGPLSLAELLSVFSRVSDAKGVLVLERPFW